MKYIIDRNGFLLNYTEDFINKGKPNGLNELDWNTIETELIPNENFIKNKWYNLEWIEGKTNEEITQEKIEKSIQIDLYYTEKISKLMSKHNDKFIEGMINGISYTIPQDVIDERQRLKNECNQLILDLGITDFSYRQNNLQLKK